jgi:hypothetical protein
VNVDGGDCAPAGPGRGAAPNGTHHLVALRPADRRGEMSMLADRFVPVFVQTPMSAGETGRQVAAAVARLRQWCCAVSRHDLVLNRERGRLSVMCARCGWDSVGWSLDPSLASPRSERFVRVPPPSDDSRKR